MKTWLRPAIALGLPVFYWFRGWDRRNEGNGVTIITPIGHSQQYRAKQKSGDLLTSF